MRAQPQPLAHNPDAQLYLDENGNVDVDTTNEEATHVDAAKARAETQIRKKTGVRRRRTQAAQDLGTDGGLMDMLQRQNAASEVAETGGNWVFSTYIDCKVGKRPLPPFTPQAA